MYAIKRILVGLDLSEQDDVLLKYIAQLNKLISPDQVYFLHVANQLDISSEILEKYPDLLAPVDESIKKNIDYSIRQNIEDMAQLKHEIIVREGDIAQHIIKTVHRKQIDLVVMGRTNHELTNLNLLRKIVRLAPCSIALIPSELPSRIDSILVPVDFSASSAFAVQQGMHLLEHHPIPKLNCLNLYDIPQGYTKTGKSFQEFSLIMKENAMAQAEEFVKEYQLDKSKINFNFQHNRDNDMAKSIFKFAIASAANLIIIGSKGRTKFASILLGSVAEHLVEYDQFLPLLVVKDKKAEFDFFEALKII